MRIRPCIDIHDGKVKQIVGSTLREKAKDTSPHDTESASKGLVQNYISSHGASYYAALYRGKNLPGGHIILLNGRESEPEAYAADRSQAMMALSAFPGGMQVGGGITPETADDFLDQGASHVIVTSYVFRNGRLDLDNLGKMVAAVGRKHLVLDLSCRRMLSDGEQTPDHVYCVVTDRWQKLTDFIINEDALDFLSGYCDEFLIHAADVEGKRGGIEKDLVELLGKWQEKSHFPITYAGGVHNLEDLDLVRNLSDNRMDVTVGSALKLFGGELGLDELVERAGEDLHCSYR